MLLSQLVVPSGTQLKHSRQLKKGIHEPTLDRRDYVSSENQTNSRRKALARGALHFAMKLTAWLSVDENAQDLMERLTVWYDTTGRYLLLDAIQEADIPSPSQDEDVEVDVQELLKRACSQYYSIAVKGKQHPRNPFWCPT